MRLGGTEHASLDETRNVRTLFPDPRGLQRMQRRSAGRVRQGEADPGMGLFGPGWMVWTAQGRLYLYYWREIGCDGLCRTPH